MANVIEVVINGVDNASGALSKVSSGIGSMVKVAAGAAAGIAAAGTAVFAFTAKMASMQDEVGKTAQRLGATTSELSKWQGVAGYANVTSETFSKSLQTLGRNSADAAQGTGAATRAFRDLNIRADEFLDLPLDDRLKTLSESFANLQTQEERVTAATQLFGNAGFKMLSMLDGNTAAMDELAKRTEFLGGVISDQAAANASVFSDRLGEVQMAVGGVSRSVANELIPVFSGMMMRVADTIAYWREPLVEFTRSAVTNIATFAIVVQQAISGVGELIKGVFSAEGFDAFVRGAWEAFLTVIKFAADSVPFIFNIMADTFRLVWESFTTLAQWAWDYVVALFGTVGELGRVLIAAFQHVWEKVKAGGQWAWDAVKAVFSGGDVPSLAEALFGGMDEGSQRAKAALDQAVGNVGASFADVPSVGDLLFNRLPEQTAAARAELASSASAFAGFLQDNALQFSAWTSEMLGIDVEAARQMAAQLIDSLSEVGKVQEDLTEESMARQRTLMEEIGVLWDDFLVQQGTATEYFAKNLFDTMQGAINGISNGVGAAIVEGQNMAKVMQNVAKQVATEVIAMLIRIGLQRMALAATNKAAGVGEAILEVGRAAVVGAANMFKAMAGAPFPINLSAPVVAVAAGAAIRNMIKGIAHGGLENVPSEGTYLLNRGERVLSPRQNRDLVDFMRGEGGGGSVTVGTINMNVLPNVTNADTFLSMDQRELEDAVAGPLIQALNSLGRRGIKLEYVL